MLVKNPMKVNISKIAVPMLTASDFEWSRCTTLKIVPKLSAI